MKTPILNAPVEYFLWSNKGKNNDKLIYYDELGQCHEKPIPSGVLEQGLNIFDGKPRAVRRSTGGLSIAEPYQIVLYDKTVLSTNTQWKTIKDPKSMIRIRVKLHDLVRSQDGLVINHQPVTQTKVVMQHELIPAFSHQIEKKQSFLMDFGRGIIPIHIFHFTEGTKGHPYALFVCVDDLQTTLSAKEREKTSLQIFQIPQAVVRITDTSKGEGKELNAALENLNQLRKTGETIIPPCLKLGDAIEVPGGSSIEMIQHFLRISTRPEDRASLEPLLIRVKNSEELLPFGLFEVA